MERRRRRKKKKREELQPDTGIGEILIKKKVAKIIDVYDAVQQQQAGDPRHVGEILVEKGSVKPQDLLDALNLQQEVRGAKAVSAMSAGPFGAEAFHLLLFREFMNAHNDPNLSKRQI